MIPTRSWLHAIDRVRHLCQGKNLSGIIFNVNPNPFSILLYGNILLNFPLSIYRTLRTIMWLSSAHHSYGAYISNHPTMSRRFVPEKGSEECSEMLRDIDAYFIADDNGINEAFNHFSSRLVQVEKNVTARNNNPNLKNRHGPAQVPYTLLYPNNIDLSKTDNQFPTTFPCNASACSVINQ